MTNSSLNGSRAQPLRVALAGFGAVGKQVAAILAAGDVPNAILSAVSARALDRASENLLAMKIDVPAVPLNELMNYGDIIIECATAESFPEIARLAMESGKTLITVSVAGLLNTPDLVEFATKHGGRIRVASGGLPGLDAIRAVKEGHISRIRLKTTFRPESLAHEPFVQSLGFDFVNGPLEKIKVFEGTAAEAAKAFPRHFNVAIALSLCGIGFERTEIEVWMDPAVEGAVQEIDVVADVADLTLISRNRPSSNPRTSRIVAPSIIAALRSYVDPIHIGT